MWIIVYVYVTGDLSISVEKIVGVRSWTKEKELGDEGAWWI